MKEATFAELVTNKTSKQFCAMNQAEYEKEQYYAHPTFYIRSLSEYIELVTFISALNKDELIGDTVIFRGMADSKFDLSPSLARFDKSEYTIEKELIDEFITRRPDSFEGLSDFDKLAKMQHYCLPTRLLDFSTNPLAALYFACESKPSKDGRILCHLTYLQNDSDPFVSEICSAAIRKNFDFNYFIDEYLCNNNLNLNQYLIKAYLCGNTTVVKPKYWNQRIANQSGVFMIFPNNLVDGYKNILKNAASIGVPKAIKEYGRGKIDEEIINYIIKTEPIDYYNDFYGKDENRELSNEYIKTIYNAYSNQKNDEEFCDKIKKYFEKRFRMSANLKLLDDETIKNSFCSIIINSKIKEKIIRELSCLGIREDYIYPELEYTAKEIKRHYK